MEENSSSIEFVMEPELVFDEKALGGRIGPKIGGGLRKPPPGMVFVDITGAIDGDEDGIVFENTPYARPIIPRAAIPRAEANQRQSAALSGALENEKRRTPVPQAVDGGSASRTGDERKKPSKQRKLTPEELRIQQEQKLRAQTVPKKRKKGPDAGEWQVGSRSSTGRWQGQRPPSEEIQPSADLRGADLSGMDLSRADLSGADLSGAVLTEASLFGADLRNADLGGADLTGANLRGADLSGANLRGADLSGAKLGGANLSGAKLGGAKMRGADLNSANLGRADLIVANLSDANLQGADLRRADLNYAVLSGAYLGGAKLDGADLRGADLRDATLLGADLRDADMREADLGGAKLNGAKLDGANLRNAFLSGADLSKAYLIGAKLDGAILDGATLPPDWEKQIAMRPNTGRWKGERPPSEEIQPGADLSGADLSGAVLTEASLFGASLRNADLGGADLTGANLRGADLSGANLRGADLSGANLEGADLTDADMREADLRDAKMRGAILYGADLSDAILFRANLIDADLDNAKLNNADLTGAKLIDANLSGANLGRANLLATDLRRANLPGADLQGANLGSANLRVAILRGAILRGADLTGAVLFGANLDGADLREADMREADLNNANLYRADLRGASLDGADLNNADLRRVNLTGMDLRGKDIYGVNLAGADLTGAILEGMDLRDVDLRRADLEGANLRDADLERAVMFEAHLKGVDLTGANLTDADLAYVNLRATKLEDTILHGADLTEANLSGMDLTTVGLTGAILERADLSDAKLVGTSLIEAKLTSAILTGANLTDAKLNYAKLYDADLTDADLTDANMVGVNLREALLVNTNLTGASLYDTDLHNVDLSGTNLRDADLANADLTGADLRDADLEDADLNDAKLFGAKLDGANLDGADLPPDWEKQVAMRPPSSPRSSVLRWEGQRPPRDQIRPGADLTGANLRRTDLSGMDLSRADLTGADLNYANLYDTDLSDANLSGADLYRAKLKGAKLRRADLANADLTGADLRDADLEGANLENASLRDANLVGANLDGATLPPDWERHVGSRSSTGRWQGESPTMEEIKPGADLTGAYLATVDLAYEGLSGADLRFAQLYLANLNGADLSDARLNHADLAGAKLNAADLRRADLANADLTGANLTGADLRNANLIDADLTRADLRLAKLDGADLRGANLDGAKLTPGWQRWVGSRSMTGRWKDERPPDSEIRPGADLSGANLRDADLRGADLFGADLRDADLSRANLSEANLSEADLFGAKLSGAKLFGADLREADLRGADLVYAYLSGAKLPGANLREADLREADMREADLTGADLGEADLDGADLTGAILERAKLKGALLREADLSLATMRGANLTEADLTEAILFGADLTDADLRYAILDGANLVGANLDGAKLPPDWEKQVGSHSKTGRWKGERPPMEEIKPGADLTEANLSGMDLSGANLRAADLRRADLANADLTGANLTGADLRNANLIDADLTRADLRLADLSDADLTEANLSGMDLRGANLRSANLTGADLRGANLDGAKLPPDWEKQVGSRSTTSRPTLSPDVSPTVSRLVDDYLDTYPPVGSKSRTGRGRGGKTFPKKSKDEKLGLLTKFLADSLIAALEESKDGKWKRPWKSLGLYRNGKTGKPYKGSNQAILSMVAEHKGYSKPIWLTYKQAQELGGQVRKGEQGTMLSFWKRSTYAVAGPDGETEEKDRWMSSFFYVFNIDQIDGIDPARFPEPEVLAEENRIETIQQIVEELGVRWKEGGDRAYNSPMDDRVQMPPFGAFDSPEAFYATLMHEIVHWTGNPGRLDRPKMNQFGSPEYAYEELIAEIGSSMLMAVLGLESRPDEQHVQYIKSWLQALKDDPGQVSQAAAAAQKAVDWLVSNSPTLKKLFDDYYPPIADAIDDEEGGGLNAPDIGDITPDTDVIPQESTNSWDYDSYGIPGSKSSTKPQYPRKPPAPAFSGRAAELIKDARSWDEFWDKMGDEEIIFIDYETTGLVFDEFNESSSNGLPTQIGAVRMRNGKVIDRFNIYVNPGIPHSEWQQWSRDNLKDQDGNPITQEFLEDKPSIAEAHQMFVDWAGQGVILGMQNAVFDNEVLEDALNSSGIDWRPDGILDTKEIADATLPKWSPENEDAPFRVDKKTGEKKPSNGLADITKYLGISLGEKHHTADFDAAATGEVLTRIVEGAIEKGWSTDILDPDKREAKEKSKQEKFDSDIAAFQQAKDKWIAEQDAGSKSRTDRSQADYISLELYEPGSKSTTRRWGSSLSRESVKSPQRRGATHVDVARLGEGDVLPDNWDAPSRPLGDPRWIVRSVRPNLDGTISITLGDTSGETDLVDVVFEKGSLVPNVRRTVGYAVPLIGNERDSEKGKPTSPKWNSPEVVYRRNAAAESTEFSLFDDDLPARTSPFEQRLFERGPMRSQNTNKLNRNTNRFTVDTVEDSMRFLADKARRDGRFNKDAAERELARLRSDISYVGLVERLDKNTIADLLEGTYTGESYKQLNEMLRRRGEVSARRRIPIGYPSSIAGSKSSTRQDGREELPTGTFVDRSIEGPGGGFWRADFGESMVKDATESASYDRDLIKYKLLADRVRAITPDELVDIAMESEAKVNKTPARRETWRSKIGEMLGKVTAINLGDSIVFVAKDGLNYWKIEKSGGLYEQFSSIEEFKKTLATKIAGAQKSNITYNFNPSNKSNKFQRYKQNIEKVKDLYGGSHIIGVVRSGDHITLWLVDEFGFPVSHRAVGMSGSPGKDDSNYIRDYIAGKEAQERFETLRGRLSADPDYLRTLIPFIRMKPVGPVTDDIPWADEPLDPSLADQVIWQIRIELDENRNPASGAEVRTLVAIDVYKIPRTDGSEVFQLTGFAVYDGDADQITVTFPTRESAIAYALSEASPHPYHAWTTNIDSSTKRRLPEGLGEKFVVDKDLKATLAGDRELSRLLGTSGSKSATGRDFYLETYAMAERTLLDIDDPAADEKFNSLIDGLSKINDRSKELLRQLEDELAKAEPDDEKVELLERAMKVHDLITQAVSDVLMDTASRNRQARLRKAALPIAMRMLIDESRDGSSIFSEAEIMKISRSLDQDASVLFGSILSQSITDRIAAALLVLKETGWPESFNLSLDEDDELSAEDLERLTDSPTDEILALARNILNSEKGRVSFERNRMRRSLLQDLDSRDSVAGFRPLLLGDATGGSKSLTRNVSRVNGRGLGDSRVIFPTNDGRNKGDAIEYAYYDGGRQELSVRFAGGSGEYIYGGISMGMAGKLERSFRIGRDINTLINNGQYSYLIKPNGDVEGEPTTLSQLLRDDMERLRFYPEFSGDIAKEIEFLVDSLENDQQRIMRLEPEYFDNISYRLWSTASKLSQVSGEHSAADHVLELINLIDEFRSSGLAGRASRRNRMPLRDKTTLNLNDDELGEIRQEVRDILRANPDDDGIAVLSRFEEQIRRAQENKSPLVLSRKDHEAYSIAYDRLFAKANNKEIDARFGRTVGESLLNLSAHSGKYDSPRLDSSGGFRGRPHNSGAPSRYDPTEIIDWAKKQKSFMVVQKLVERYESNDGFLTAPEWLRLGEYYISSRRRSGGGGSSSRSTTSRGIQGSRSSTERSDTVPSEPTDADLAQIEGESDGGAKKKKTKLPPGKSISEIFGNRLDGLSPEEQINAMFEVGVATNQNKDGINQQEFEARVRDLEVQRLEIEATEQEQAMRKARSDAVRSGVEFNEEEWWEGYITARENRHREIIDRYMKMLLGDDIEKRTKAERFLGITREQWVQRQEEQERFRLLEKSTKKENDTRKTKTSYPLPELIRRLRGAAQRLSGALSSATDGDDGGGELWETIDSILEELDSDRGKDTPPDILLEQIADMLEDYARSEFGLADSDRSSGYLSSEVKKSKRAARQWKDIILNSLGGAESEEDDEIDDKDDGDSPVAGSKSTTARQSNDKTSLFSRPKFISDPDAEYELGFDAGLDRLVSDPRNWQYDDTWGQKKYYYTGPWPSTMLSFPKNPPSSIRDKIQPFKTQGPGIVLLDGSKIPLYDNFPRVPDELKNIIIDGIHMAPQRDELELYVGLLIPGADGARSIEMPGSIGRKKRYRRRRPYWRDGYQAPNSDLSQMTDEELKNMLRAFGYPTALFDPTFEPFVPRRLGNRDPGFIGLIIDPEDLGPGSTPRKPKREHSINDIIGELDRRGYNVYESEDESSDWYIVEKSDATDVEVSRRIGGSWSKRRDETTPPNDRVEPDGDREIDPVDYVMDIIDSENVEVDPRRLIDLIDNSDIDEMSMDEVNGELITIRDELEDLRRRANKGEISRIEYNERRRELNRRKEMLLRKKHGNKDAARQRTRNKPRRTTPRPTVTVNNSGNTTINVSGDGNTVISSGGQISSSTPTVGSRRKATTQVGTSGIDELRKIEQARSAVRGEIGPISGSKSSTGDGEKLINFYKMEFGMTGDDFEEIVHGVGSEETIKEKHGITDEDIALIRANWRSALPVDDLARANGHDELDVQFITLYDDLLNRLDKKIRRIKDEQNERANQLISRNQNQLNERLEQIKSDAEREDYDDRVASLKQLYADDLSQKLKALDFLVQYSIDDIMRTFRRGTAVEFMTMYAEGGKMPQADIPYFIKSLGLLDMIGNGQLAILLLDSMGVPDEMFEDVMSQLSADVESAFLRSRNFAEVIEEYGGAWNSVIHILTPRVFLRELFGADQETWRTFVDQGTKPSLFDSQKINFPSFDEYVKTLDMPSDPEQRTAISKAYLESLATAYDLLVSVVRDQPGLVVNGQATPRLALMYVKALRGSLFPHIENIDAENKSSIKWISENLSAGVGSQLDDDSEQLQFDYMSAALWDLYEADSVFSSGAPFWRDSIGLLGQVTGLSRDEILEKMEQHINVFYDPTELSEINQANRRDYLEPKILRFFKNGLSLSEISKLTGYSEEAIMDMVRQNPNFERYIRMVQSGFMLRDAYQVAVFEALRDAGLTAEDIALKLRLDPDVVQDILDMLDGPDE